jgi:hypothetical protein
MRMSNEQAVCETLMSAEYWKIANERLAPDLFSLGSGKPQPGEAGTKRKPMW